MTTARRLATIPGIGPITASLIAATVGDNIGAFKSARHFAAWLGPGAAAALDRRQDAAWPDHQGRQPRDPQAAGARAPPRWSTGPRSGTARPGRGCRACWSGARCGWSTVALANKMARIAWALMTRKEVYQAKGRAAAAAASRGVTLRARLVGGGRKPG